MEAEIHRELQGMPFTASAVNVDIEAMLGRWLEKVKAIASKFNAKDYTITLALSWPPGIQASFSFSIEAKLVRIR